jgi:glucosamine-6-phosphate deaminase
VSAFALQVLPDPEAVADRVCALLLEERLGRPVAPLPLGLATGRTMEPIYARLVARARELPPAELHRLREGWRSFNLDEYVGLPPSDPRSFAAAMAAHLVEPLGLDPARVLLPQGTADDPAAEARRYGTALAEAGGLGLQLLGLGLNGHVGFNEPPCAASAPCRCVVLEEATRLQNAAAFCGEAAAVPERAITLGLAEILEARRLVLVVTGAGKARVLRRLLEELPSPELPASWLRDHPDCLLLVDRAALG